MKLLIKEKKVMMVYKRKKTPLARKRKPKLGGFIPLALLGPLIAGIGGLAAGSASIAQAVNSSKADAKLLQETQRHNKKIEGKGIKKKNKNKNKKKKKRAKGLFLRPRMT